MGKDTNLSGSLIHVARLCRTRRASLLLDLGLYAGQDMLLKSLAESDGQSMGSLATNLGVRPPTITKMVTRMSVQGLVRREPSAFDSRQSHVFLTDGGRELLDRIDDSWKRAEDIAFSGLTEKDYRRLRKILGKIWKNLEPSSKDA